MHFHLPKPLHGWREFAGEIAIIVIGVLIALGAEQVVEAAHWEHRADDARQALRHELEGHYFAAKEAIVTEPCIDAQLKGLEDSLDRTPRTPAPIYSDGSDSDFVFRAPSRPWSDNIWSSIVGEGVASHLDKGLRDNLGDHYAQAVVMRDNSRANDQMGWMLNVLGRSGALDTTTRLLLAQDIEEARGRFSYMAIVGGQIVGRLDYEMKMAPPAGEVADELAQSGTVKFCRAHHLPLAGFKASGA